MCTVWMVLYHVIWGYVSVLFIVFRLSHVLTYVHSGAVTAAEVPHLQLRDKSSMVVYLTQFVCDFVVSYTLPYLLGTGYANLHSKVGFIYGGFGIIGLVWAFFCLPDMSGRSLEELEIMWTEKVPARQFRSMSTPHASL